MRDKATDEPLCVLWVTSRACQVFDVRMEAEPEQQGYSRRSTLRFAFPVTPHTTDGTEATDGTSKRTLFRVYATLPLDDVGLPFLINGDWEATTNRDMVQTADPWNVLLHRALPGLLLRLFEEDSFFKADGGRRIAEALPLREELTRRRDGRFDWWLHFVLQVQREVQERGLLQRTGLDQWVVSDDRLQRLVPTCLWSGIGMDVLSCKAKCSSPELLRLLQVKQVGWSELAKVMAAAQEREASQGVGVEDPLVQWLRELREQRFDPLFEYLASSATGGLAQLAMQCRGTEEPHEALVEFRHAWSQLCIFRGESHGTCPEDGEVVGHNMIKRTLRVRLWQMPGAATQHFPLIAWRLLRRATPPTCLVCCCARACLSLPKGGVRESVTSTSCLGFSRRPVPWCPRCCCAYTPSCRMRGLPQTRSRTATGPICAC